MRARARAARYDALSRSGLGCGMVEKLESRDMEFGIFDHVDRNGLPLREFYASRLELAEAYDALGFYAYHIAEHHFTPLGMAPSPSVFLAAVARATRHLRFGPLVYALPLHSPLRLLEEICMLDQLSGGRLDIGFGRGSSPVEIAFYGQDPAEAQDRYNEGLQVIFQGLRENKIRFRGRFFAIDADLSVECLQKPHPPIWYGVHSAQSAERAARDGFHVVSLDGPDDSRSFFASYRETRRQCAPTAAAPKLGIGRFVVVAETDAVALEAARRAYPVWHRSFYHLFRLRGVVPAHPRPETFDALMERGQGAAGSPETVAEFVNSQITRSGATYFVSQFAFGDLSLDECLRSAQLFARHVMPLFRASG